MNRTEKQRNIANEATALAFDLQHGADAFFGNAGVTLYANGTAGDVVGVLLVRSGVAVKEFTTDPGQAVAWSLGVKKENLPENLQQSINLLAEVSDDTKRAYARRIPRLVKALNAFASLLTSTKIEGNARTSTKSTFQAPGVSL